MKNGKVLVTLCALLIAAALPLTAMAEPATTEAAATATTATAAQRVKGVRGQGLCVAAFDTSTLTDEQKAAYDDALALYRGVEDEVLADLVNAGTVTQAQVDEYKAQRAAQDAYEAVDQSSWTAQQYKAYYEACALTGTARDEALDALVAAGQLTQAQADAMKDTSSAGLWQTLAQNANTNAAVESAINTMSQAQRTFCQTLADAGIQVGRGMGMNSFSGGMGRGGRAQGKTQSGRSR